MCLLYTVRMETCMQVRKSVVLLLILLPVLSLADPIPDQPQGDDPLSQRLTLEYTRVEEIEANTEIANLARDAQLQREYGDEIFRNLHYKFVRQGDKAQEYFRIDETRGLLISDKTIDREQICQHKVPVCVIEFEVSIYPIPVHHLKMIGVKVTVLDINDNAPEFPRSQISFSISENVMPGASFVIPTARDPDSKPYAIQRYEFFSNTDMFSLKVLNSTDGTIDLRLILEKKLDREQRDFYQMQVVTKDGGKPAKTGTILVNVTVLDSNDNSPKFDQPAYEVRVDEDSAPGTTIIRVHASDPDEGASGSVIYSLSADTGKDYSKLFAINNVTGEIFLIGEMDYEKDKIYTLLVTALDQGPDAVPTHARVMVRVRDVNDHGPAITVNALTTSGQVEIPENAEPGHFVAHISIEDNDGGRNGEVLCGLNDDHFMIQRIYRNEYKIVTSRRFDREVRGSFRILLDCQDQGSFPRRSTAEIIVVILDKNDNSPEFSQDTYVVNMRENNSVNTAILIVNATDRDSGNNGRLTYKISEDARGLVAIDARSGVIRANVAFDYEERHNFRFEVIAKDNGEPSNTATTTVILNLKDINDEVPIFSRHSYTFASLENQPAGVEIGSVSATDPDEPPFNVVRFSLDPADASSVAFEIEAETGRITTKKVLDREHKPSYALTVIAGNPGYPLLTSTATVTVNVADVNDNAPMIMFPNKENYTIQVPINAPVGYLVTRVEAKDADFKGHLEYTIAKGNEESMFKIDKSNGYITINSKKVGHTQEWYYMLIMVKDNGKPQKSAVADLHIFVNKSIPYKDGKAMTHTSPFGSATQNQTIVISLAAATVFLIIILITAIVLIKKKQNRGKREEYRYMCQVDLAAQRTASGKDSQDSDCPPESECLRQPNVACPVTEDDHRKKEVRFSVEDVAIDAGSTKTTTTPVSWRDGQVPTENNAQVPDYPGRGGHVCRVTSFGYHDNAEGHPCRDHMEPPDVTQNFPRHRLVTDPCCMVGSRPWTLTERELEVHQLLQMVMRDPAPDSDSTSGCSADMSNTDSGRGPSEDGDQHVHSNCVEVQPPAAPPAPPPPYESLWVPQNSSNTQVHPESGEVQDGSSTLPRPAGAPVVRGDGTLPRGTYPPPPRPPNTRQKYPMHRKVLTNNSLAPPGRRPNNKRPLPYNKIPMPHRLVDPRENGMEGNTNHAYQGGSLKRGDNHTVAPVANHTNSNNVQAVPSNGTAGSQTQSQNPEEPQYVNTFGQKIPLRQLGRLDENQDEMSDDSGTTTSGSYDMEHPPGADRHRVPGVTHMDTVV